MKSIPRKAMCIFRPAGQVAKKQPYDTPAFLPCDKGTEQGMFVFTY